MKAGLSASWQVALAIAGAAALGWLVGYPLQSVALASLACLLYWRRRLSQVIDWIDHPAAHQPPLGGDWAGIISRVASERALASAREARLGEEVRYLNASLSSMRDGVLIADRHGQLRYWNRAAGQLLGVHFPEGGGESFERLVPYPEFCRYLQAGAYEEPLQFKTGGDGDMALHLTISRFGEGDRLMIVRDVTRRVRMDEVRRDFVGNVSHELRTPLTVISGYLDTLLGERENLPAGLVRPLEQMQQQADRMESLLRDLLWLSRIESEEREEKKELVDVAALLEELSAEVAGSNPGRRLILRVTASARVIGDYRELYSAVSNLVQNAIKYSDPDTPVSISWRLGVGGYHLSVTDQGMGIEAAHIPRLTERFYRVDDSRSSATGGTGLGLAIVKHVAASHGAQLSIESAPGRGSTFSLVFPYRPPGSSDGHETGPSTTG